MLMYLINPINDREEKLITTPFLSVFYIISFSYILSFVGIPMYKIYYLFPLIAILILKAIVEFTKNKNKEILIFHFGIPKIQRVNLKNNHIILILIIICALFFSYSLFPKYPCEKWDSQFHSYKIKAMMLEKTIFYKDLEYRKYLHYPAGFHCLVYFLADKISEIPHSIYLLEFYIILLFVFAHYYLGRCIKKDLGIYTAVFVPLNYEFYRIILRAIFPNTLGYCLFLILIAFLLKYKLNGSKIYLYLFSFGTFSLIFTHTFPFLMLILFLISLIIFDIVHFNYKDLINYSKYFFLSLSLSLTIIVSKILNDVLKYSNASYVIEYIKPYILKETLIVLIGVFGSTYLITTILALFSPTRFFYGKFVIYLIFGSVYFILFIFGTIFLIKNRLGYFILYILLMELWLINNQLIGFKIPFFSALYNPIRWFYNFQILTPLFYGCGLYYISKKIKKLTNKGLLILPILLIIMGFLAYNFYIDTSKNYWRYYLVGDDEIDAFNFINKNNISNELFLNFGEDSGQFIPIFTKNKCVFCYGNGNTFKNISVNKIINYTWNYNYSNFIQFCKSNNITYVFISKNVNVNREFFNNSRYFEEVYFKNNITILKIRYE